MKTKKTILRALVAFCVLALFFCCVKVVKVWRVVDQGARRSSQMNDFTMNAKAFQDAFDVGDYEEAFRRACACEEAGKGIADDPLYVDAALFMKARSAEMKGDYDVAATCYATYKGNDDDWRGSVATFEPRLAYKQGKTAEAFRGYCELFAKEASDGSIRPLYSAQSRILTSDRRGCDAVLCPFADYASFLSFMEAEFKAQGEPAENVPTMEFFRSQAEKEAAETE